MGFNSAFKGLIMDGVVPPYPLRLHYMQWDSFTVMYKVYPRKDHEDPEREWSYSSTLPSTSALNGGWVVNATSRPHYSREGPGTHCIGGWVGPRAGLDGCGKSRPSTRIRSPDLPARPARQ